MTASASRQVLDRRPIASTSDQWELVPASRSIATICSSLNRLFLMGSSRLEKVPGIGPITATALVATVGNATNFDSGRPDPPDGDLQRIATEYSRNVTGHAVSRLVLLANLRWR